MATTPVFLPGESQGWGSLVGCRLWGRTESDMTEATQQQQQSFSIFSCKEYNQSDFAIDHLVTSVCRVVSCVVVACYSRYLLTSYFAFQSSMMKRTSFFFWCYFQKVLQVFIELINFSFFGISGWSIDLDYCDVEWFALEKNQDHSVIFEIAPKYCILDCFVDYEGYSISSKGFLPIVVYIMVISIKFPHSIHFRSLIPMISTFTLPSPS